jgi:hypothetical protein
MIEGDQFFLSKMVLKYVVNFAAGCERNEELLRWPAILCSRYNE